MTLPSFRPIYDRHQGPYVLLLLREDAKGKQYSDRITGTSLRAQAAHEKALDLINDRDPSKTDVHSVYVFSEVEGQFTGALYQRGEQYADWEHLPIDDAPPAPAPPAPQAPVKPRRLEVRHDDVESPTTEAGVPAPAPARPRPVKAAGSRFPAMRGKALAATTDPEAKWPASPPAQMVKRHFESQGPDYRATAPELVAALGAALTEIGVAFPASLISRLKQAGLLREDAPRASTTEEKA